MSGHDHAVGTKLERPDPPAPGSPGRTGPVGRAGRLLIAAALGWLAAQWIEAGPGWFSQPRTAGNPWVWAVTVLAVYTVVVQIAEVGFGHRWRLRVAAGLAVLGTAAGVVAMIASGGLWATPFTDLVYWFDLTYLVTTTLAFLVSVVLGTPGCEVGAIAQLYRRIRGESNPEAMWCVVGLHRLDAWEARQPWRRNR